eukprot:GDKJ01032236.1.p2 GENE.GDKJ01032236.1~~GDKJ01032236.1.p2  ORF type:complete len:119 (-),score=1.85 GDKJ01032236.1:627-983(-)
MTWWLAPLTYEPVYLSLVTIAAKTNLRYSLFSYSRESTKAFEYPFSSFRTRSLRQLQAAESLNVCQMPCLETRLVIWSNQILANSSFKDMDILSPSDSAKQGNVSSSPLQATPLPALS